jgi:hypothetical protein
MSRQLMRPLLVRRPSSPSLIQETGSQMSSKIILTWPKCKEPINHSRCYIPLKMEISIFCTLRREMVKSLVEPLSMFDWYQVQFP